MSSDPYHSLKCGVASFFANYVVGFFHPLELIKTRLQSICNQIQVMMENQAKILFLSMMVSSEDLKTSTTTKDSKDCIRDCITIFLVKV